MSITAPFMNVNRSANIYLSQLSLAIKSGVDGISNRVDRVGEGIDKLHLHISSERRSAL